MPADSQAGRKGKAVEHLLAASCILASNGELNASTTLVDDEGIDVIFHRRGWLSTISVQVKSRFRGSSQLERGRFIGSVREGTFRSRQDFYLLFVVVEPDEPRLGPLWLVRSDHFEQKARPQKTQRRLSFSASSKKSSEDKWREYRMDTVKELTDRILGILSGPQV